MPRKKETKKITINDLKRLCYAKHGEREANRLAATLGGSISALSKKDTWYRVLHHRPYTEEEVQEQDVFRDSILDRLKNYEQGE